MRSVLDFFETGGNIIRLKSYLTIFYSLLMKINKLNKPYNIYKK